MSEQARAAVAAAGLGLAAPGVGGSPPRAQPAGPAGGRRGWAVAV